MPISQTPIDYYAGTTRLRGLLCRDPAVSASRPGILVVHEAWGCNDYPKRRALQLAELGYVALALDMYGDGRTATDLDGAMQLFQEATADFIAMRQRFDAALQVLRSQPGVQADKIAAIGYCFGGTVVTQMALEGLDLALVASFHGGLNVRPPEPPVPVKAHVLVCHGEADVLVTPETVATFKSAMAKGSARLDFVNYPGAMHGFSNPGATEKAKTFGMPVGYDAATDADSWMRLQTALAAL